jgi:Tfp pilus assembly protein PilN
MRPLELDFVKRPRAARWVGSALLAAGIAAAAGAGGQYVALHARLARAEASMLDAGRAARQRAPLAGLAADPKKVALEIQQAQVVMVRLRLPWQELFASIEAARNPSVALLSIESDREKRRVKIYGEAKDLDAMALYLAQIRQSRALTDAYLESHELQLKDPQHPVRFVLGANWSVGR